MPIVFKCPKCQSKLTAGDDKAGSKFPCPKCNQRLQVPTPPPPPPPPPQPTEKTMLGEMEIPPELKTVLGEMEPVLQTPRIEVLCPKCRMTFYALAGPPGSQEPCPLCGVNVPIPPPPQVAPAPPSPQPSIPLAQPAPLPAVVLPAQLVYTQPTAAPNPWANMENARSRAAISWACAGQNGERV